MIFSADLYWSVGKCGLFFYLVKEKHHSRRKRQKGQGDSYGYHQYGRRGTIPRIKDGHMPTGGT